MNLNAIIRKVISWIKGEANGIETRIAVDAETAEKDIAGRVSQIKAAISVEADGRQTIDVAPATPSTPVVVESSIVTNSAATGTGWSISKDGVLSFSNSNTEVNMNNVNVAIQIALALKANDPSLTDAAVQAATNAALAAAYPAPAPAA